ncbi:hypothetical protein ASG25_04505 [Rhizobium sp. Leaf384]|uniref:hypothetical protein n=1 Tax=unclassified Rhizobium TaxID=2613769 RepID=UPI0007135576|nr:MULTISPECIES: hypothetical protein [unclassified Rhizobium]KQS77275.1 hypothetical protein ASG58_09745 [Rhizobium sp. Leaf383]KQS80802.1 hypothetical protein ASG25_04505 [Rhizobium sp. Leaf384]
MRALLLALSLLCAILSGWTSAVAQAQGLAHGVHGHVQGTTLIAQGAGVAAPAVSLGDDDRHSGPCDCAHGCHTSGKGAHPMLCSACFALEIEADHGKRPALPAQGIRPALDRPLIAFFQTPTPPPPRSLLST